MKIRDGYVVRKVAGIHLVVPVGENASGEHGMIQLNDTGMLLWDKLALGAEKEDLVNCLLQTYDVTNEIAERDVEAFIGLLKKADIFEA